MTETTNTRSVDHENPYKQLNDPKQPTYTTVFWLKLLLKRNQSEFIVSAAFVWKPVQPQSRKGDT